ncbi:hypothetical protein FRC09_012056 [Ceratobasidium sp. 395]|nr:hypothetical protein FRC09_012056 [Ceratobasidium sp. 395]
MAHASTTIILLTNAGHWTMNDVLASESIQTAALVNDARLFFHRDDALTNPGALRSERWEQLFIGKCPDALHRLRLSFGFNDLDTTRRASKEGLGPLRGSRSPAPSGVLSPKPVVHLSGRETPVQSDQKASNPSVKEVRLKPLVRHTHWRLTPSEKLPLSPLNPTATRARLLSRKNITLCGSEDRVEFDNSYLPPQTLRPFGQILPGSTPEQCTIAPPNRTFSEADKQPNYAPPPCVKPKVPRRRLDEITAECCLAQSALNSCELLETWVRGAEEMTESIRNAYNTGLVSSDKITEWRAELAAHCALLTNLCKMVARGVYDGLNFDIGMQFRGQTGRRLRVIRNMLSRLSPNDDATYAVLRRDAVHRFMDQLGEGFPPEGASSISVSSQSSQHPSTQPTQSNESATVADTHDLHPEHSSATQTHDSTPSIPKAETCNPGILLEVIDAIPSAPVLSESALKIVFKSQSAPQIDVQTNMEGYVSQEQASPSRVQENKTPTPIVASASDRHISQHLHPSRPRKRAADGDSTQDSTPEAAEEVPSKRRRTE